MQQGEEVDVSNKKRAMLVKKEGPISIEGCHNRAQQKEDHSRSSKIIGCERHSALDLRFNLGDLTRHSSS
jgi:hypothetical protein